MSSIAVTLLLVIACAFVAAHPKRMWELTVLLILAYPQNLLYGLLPLNIGLDDLLIVFTGARYMFWDRPVLRLYPPRTFSLGIVVAFLAMFTISNATGSFLFPELWNDTIKDCLKFCCVILFVFSTRIRIATADDCMVVIRVLAIGSIIAGLIVVLCYFVPAVEIMCEVYKSEGLRESLVLNRFGRGTHRVLGTFLSPDGVGVFACLMIPFFVALLASKRLSLEDRLLLMVASIAIAVALLMSKSRSGLAGLSVGVIGLSTWSIFTLQNKRFAMQLFTALAVAGAVLATLLVARPELGSALAARLTIENMETTGMRLEVWQMATSSLSLDMLFFGAGAKAFSATRYCTPHSSYLDMFLLWGVGGVIITVTFYFRLFRSSLRAISRGKSTKTFGGTIGIGVLWSTVACLVFGIFADLWFISFYQFFVFVMLCLVEQVNVIQEQDALNSE
ncbi:MAG: hypothetical protein JW888_14710 [Pirellulales bacterium]|nr:hypothetical protein [Pirellulales bacterium]